MNEPRKDTLLLAIVLAAVAFGAGAGVQKLYDDAESGRRAVAREEARDAARTRCLERANRHDLNRDDEPGDQEEICRCFE